MKKLWDKFYPAGVASTIYVKEKNLIEKLKKGMKKYPDKVVFHSMGKEMTSGEVDLLSTRFAASLQKRLGVKKGDRIALMLPNLLQFPIALLGIWKAGGIAIPLNPTYTKTELNKVLFLGVDGNGKGAAKPKVLITLNKFGSTVEDFAKENKIENIVMSEVGDLLKPLKGRLINFALKFIKKEIPTFKIENSVSFKSLLDNDENELKEVDVSMEDIAILQLTGGTSGTIKAAKLTHSTLSYNLEQNIATNAVDIGDGRHWKSEDTSMVMLPAFHVFAMMTGILIPIRLSSRAILIPNPRDLDFILKTWSKYEINSTSGINTLFSKLVNRKEFNSKNINFKGLNLVFAGGMATDRNVAKKFKKITGRTLQVGYGLSETSPVIVGSTKKCEFIPSCVGIPYPLTDIKLLGDKGEIVNDPSLTGEICVRGPQVMSDYWGLEDKHGEYFTECGYFRTGDIGKWDLEGRLYVVDRKKDMVNVSGLKVFPQEVENTANIHENIIESGVISIPDSQTGEAVMLFVVSNNDSLCSDDVKGHCRKHLAAYKIPKKVMFIDEVPKSQVGKLLRRELKKLV
jgi:long-chain acyl-CoA synthetase